MKKMFQSLLNAAGLQGRAFSYIVSAGAFLALIFMETFRTVGGPKFSLKHCVFIVLATAGYLIGGLLFTAFVQWLVPPKKSEDALLIQ